MKSNLIAKVTIVIDADRTEVWKGLTDPALVREYFFGTEVDSNWKKGSLITFRGSWEGKSYEDKGTILEIESAKFLKYNYWSSFSGMPDLPENYATVTYELESKGKQTTLTVTQDSIATLEARDHSEKNWIGVLDGLKNLLEKGLVKK